MDEDAVPGVGVESDMSKPTKQQVEELQRRLATAYEQIAEASSEEKRLSAQNCDFQLQIHNLQIEHRALFQALHDCQKLRKTFQDRVQSLEIQLRCQQP